MFSSRDSVGSTEFFEQEGTGSNFQCGQHSLRGLMTAISPAVHGFDDAYVEKQPVVWKEYHADSWLGEFIKAWIGALAAVM